MKLCFTVLLRNLNDKQIYLFSEGIVKEKDGTQDKNSYSTLKLLGIKSKPLFQTICFLHSHFPKKCIFDLAFTDE